SGRYVLGHVFSSRDLIGVLGSRQLPEKHTLVPRVACVPCRWSHVAHNHGREGKAALRIFKFQTLNSSGKLAGSPIAASKTAPGFYARPSPINSGGQSALSNVACENLSFAESCRGLSAKDPEDQRRQLPRR
ncbi:hypothetical protein TIFTF001_043989, partial [Ficus carica]